MEDTKLDEAIKETTEQSFNDSELKDIMSEIESLEKEFVEESEGSEDDLAVVNTKKTDLQNEIDKEIESVTNEMASDEDLEADELISEMDDDTVSDSDSHHNVVSLHNHHEEHSHSQGAAMGFSASGTMDFSLNFSIGDEAATLKVDGEKGLCVEMGGVVIEITQEHGCTVTMEGGVNFNIPLTTSTNTAKKKAA